jgi:hypothetical protein
LVAVPATSSNQSLFLMSSFDDVRLDFTGQTHIRRF